MAGRLASASRTRIPSKPVSLSKPFSKTAAQAVPPKAKGPGAVLLAHGAGGHKDHPHLRDLSDALAEAGLIPFRFNFPYRAEGRSFPDRMPVLVERFRKEADRIVARHAPRFLILAGHSLGSRAALALAAEGYPCRGVMLFSYPLHPPGRPEKLRLENLDAVPVPVLSLSGTRDAFCTPRLMEETLKLRGRGKPPWTHHWLEGADHGLAVVKSSGRTRAEVLAEIEVACEAWLPTLER